MIAKVLLVDDNDDLRATLKAALTRDHQIVIEASDGAEAFAMAESEEPHIIVMDIVMNGLYGTTALDRLRANPSTAKIPVILMSGSTDMTALRGALTLPAVRFLRKPLRVEEIMKTIRELLPEGGYTV